MSVFLLAVTKTSTNISKMRNYVHWRKGRSELLHFDSMLLQSTHKTPIATPTCKKMKTMTVQDCKFEKYIVKSQKQVYHTIKLTAQRSW